MESDSWCGILARARPLPVVEDAREIFVFVSSE